MNNQSYEIAKQRYASIGIDTDEAINILKNISISMHCWQGDDVQGFDNTDALSGGIQATGTQPRTAYAGHGKSTESYTGQT